MKIKDLAINGLFCDGDWVESKDQDPSGDIRLIQLADIGNGNFMDKSNRFMNRETAESLKCTYLKKGDILVARMPDPIGRACLFPLEEENKYVTVVDVGIIRLNEDHSSEYVMYGINSPLIRRQIESQVTGTTRQRITRKKIGEIDIPLPPLTEQKRFAAILDTADTYRQKTKALIEKYDQLTQSLFLEMFGDPVTNPKGWEKKTLLDIVSEEKHSLKRGPFGGALKKEIFKESGYKVYEQKNAIQKNVKDGKYFIDELKYKEMEAFTVNSGDFIISCSGTIGEIFQIPEEAPIGIINQALMKIKVNEEIIHPIFFESLFIYYIKDHIFISGSKGSGLKNVSSMKIIKEEEFIVPDIENQMKYVQAKQNLKTQKAQVQVSLEKAEDLFNALLQNAFLPAAGKVKEEL